MDQMQEQQAPMGEASTEQKEMFARVIGIAGSLIWEETKAEAWARVFQAAGDPARGAASLTATIGIKVIEAAQREGFNIPGPSILGAGYVVLSEVRDFAAEKLGIEMTDEQFQQAFMFAADQVQDYVNKRGGIEITDEDMAGLQQARAGAPDEAPVDAMAPRRGLGARV